MNFKNTPLWQELVFIVFIFFGVFVLFNVDVVMPVNRDILAVFYGVPLKEHLNFVALVYIYAMTFIFFYVVAFLAYCAAWLINCIGIHIEYRKPQRVYPLKTK